MKTLISIVIATTACGPVSGSGGGTDARSGSGGGDGGVDAPSATHDAAPSSDAPTSSSNVTIFTIVLENHDYAEVVGSSNAPYLNSLITQGALATNYMDSGTHPSLPNYLYMISGSDQGISADVLPTASGFPTNQPNLGTQLQAAGVKWRSYQESMGTACKLSTSGSYAPKHDPFLYFTDQQNGPNNLCASTNVDFSQFGADLATNTYRYMWITPNLVSDGHNGSPTTALRVCDTWMSQQVPAILNSAAFQNGGVLMITWDEAVGRNGHSHDQVPMIILSKKVKQAGMTSATAYSHASYLATVEDLLNLPRLSTVTNVPSMTTFLNP